MIPGEIDEQIVADLLAATPAVRTRLRDVLDEIRNLSATHQLATWPESVGSGTSDDPYQMPYPIYDPLVEQLLSALAEANAQPMYDWMDWDGARRYRDADAIAHAPLGDVLRVITSIVRGERFCDGTIGAAISSGVLVAAADRVSSAIPPIG